MHDPTGDELAERLSQGAGVRKAAEHEGEPGVHEDERRGHGEERDEAADAIGQPRLAHDLAAREAVEMPVGGLDDARPGGPMDAEQQPQQQDEDERRGKREPGRCRQP